ncbi:hypothetical protein NDN08_002995 [Rhodosorus marinus]|uniref:N-acetyltransferase domain-containing protein n=1 Tax=Rhodosorus marinus TaxID=101924 RepID=A0AAV8UZJ6_9RHOD|nr:hypothetical protein NDN08_002995 [Rhodosorus marinus]
MDITRASCRMVVVTSSLSRAHADLINKASRGALGRATQGVKTGDTGVDRIITWSDETKSYVSRKNSVIFGKVEIEKKGSRTVQKFTAGALLSVLQRSQVSGAPFDNSVKGLRPHAAIIEAFNKVYQDCLYVSYIVNDVDPITKKNILPKFSPLIAIDIACAEARCRNISYLLGVIRESNPTAEKVWTKAGFNKLSGSNYSIKDGDDTFNGYFLDVNDADRKQARATPEDFKLKKQT